MTELEVARMAAERLRGGGPEDLGDDLDQELVDLTAGLDEEPEDDPDDDDPAELRPAAVVPAPGAEDPAPAAPLATELVVPEPAAVDEQAEALRFLREYPHRPAAGPDGLLMRWLQARKVVGLDQEPQPVRRRRQRRR
jgi:hypothetical protein